jgi:LacI family transcriptional regulator
MSRITIRDVASRAGVSYQTVSRVINNSPDVSEATRAQVWLAIEHLGYHPNVQAIGLSRNRSDTIGMIAHDAGDAFYSQIVAGASRALTESGRFMILIQTNRLDQPTAIERLIHSRRIDGLILVLPLSLSLERARQLAESQLPLVLVDLQYDLDVDHISVDNVAGAYSATEHLIKLGHRRIGIIVGRNDIPVGQMRLDGYQQAHRDYGVPVDPGLITYGDFSPESGKLNAAQLLALEERPTAIFACNDMMAFGAYTILAERGMRVPEDLALVGFDDLPQAALFVPALTTVRQPLHTMGQLAAEHLCRVLDHTAIAPLRMILKPELIVRDSCGANGGERSS